MCFVCNYNNIVLENVTDEELERVLNTEEYRSMTVWPASGSVAIIDRTVVIKLSEP